MFQKYHSVDSYCLDLSCNNPGEESSIIYSPNFVMSQADIRAYLLTELLVCLNVLQVS